MELICKNAPKVRKMTEIPLSSKTSVLGIEFGNLSLYKPLERCYELRFQVWCRLELK